MITALTLIGCGPPAPFDEVGENASAPNSNLELLQPETPKGSSMSSREVLITTEGGQLTARLSDNQAARALARMLPLQVQMRDHLRQEKTGELQSALPQAERQRAFSTGTLGLWGDRDVVIYYREGSVPAPGIVILGHVEGDLSQFDNADEVTISVQHADQAPAELDPLVVVASGDSSRLSAFSDNLLESGSSVFGQLKPASNT